MKKFFSNILLTGIIGLIIVSCANRGNPGGGPKDTTPPTITRSTPANYSTNFKDDEIRIYFDEFIKIKDLQKQLIISPPMNTQPEITPLGGASKFIRIKIFDTLQPNTTYAFNFGNSIVDNNEENPFPYYKYVFSTGDYIDSLSVKGKISDALLHEPDDFVSVMLYEVDSTYNDSVIYKKKPRYITNTLDSTTTFSLENLKVGKYLLIAVKDKNQDFKFQQKSDKIGFYSSYISIPSDSIYNIKLFKEDIDFSAKKPRLISGEKIAFGYEGDYENMTIELLSPTPEDFKYKITKEPQKDSLNYWYIPRLQTDSLQFKVTGPAFEEIFDVRISEQPRDTMVIKASPNGAIKFEEEFKLTSNTPFTKIDESKITIMDKDSTFVEFSTKLDTLMNSFSFQFEKTESNQYTLQVLPVAFTDLFENTNDTLQYKLRTKQFSDYGNIRVKLNGFEYPVIIQLTNNKGDVKAEKYSEKPEWVDFIHLDPGTYFLRVILDSNKNGKYDSGNFLKHQQPEEVIHNKEAQELNANWDQIIEFSRG